MARNDLGSNDTWGCLVFIIMMIIILAVITGCSQGWSALDCHMKTREMTIESRYTIWNGCQVQDAELGWVNYDRLRLVVE